MFRINKVFGSSLRWIQSYIKHPDTLQWKLQRCSNAHQIFELVEVNKSVLAARHVKYALKALCDIKQDNTNVHLHEITNHPEFTALQYLVENKVSTLDDYVLISILLSLSKLNVKADNSLVQQLALEGRKRLKRFDMYYLSLFITSLSKHNMLLSPLCEQMVDIVEQKLDSINSLRILSCFMVKLQKFCSKNLQLRMLTKAESILDVGKPPLLLDIENILVFLNNMGASKHVLWQKCVQFLMENIMHITIRTFNILEYHIHTLLEFPEVQVKVKSRLLELLESCSKTRDFLLIFRILFPMASQETKERLENNLLDLAHEVPYTQLPNILRSLSMAKCKNLFVCHMICNMVKNNLHLYQPQDLCMIAEALLSVPHQNGGLLDMVRRQIVQAFKTSQHFKPYLIKCMIQNDSLSIESVDNDIISKLNDVVPQFDLRQTSAVSSAVKKWILKNPQQSGCKQLYQKLNRHAEEIIRNTKNLDVLLSEITRKENIIHYDYSEIIMETCKHSQHQINLMNVPIICELINQSFIRCTAVMDKIAEVVKGNPKEFSASEILCIVRAFSFANYDSPNRQEFYAACIQHCDNIFDSFAPNRLVLLAFEFALAEYFPRKWIKAIFNDHFLKNLDSLLNGCIPIKPSPALIREHLMQLNRAVCLECPEYEIPWFHEQYCQEHLKNERSENSTDFKFEELLSAALGGPHYLRMSVVTPYYYSIDFECILDKNKKPVSYMDPILLSTGIYNEQPESKTQKYKPLPPGLQRVAVDFLPTEYFCRDTYCVNGLTAMKKRHLEILGYSVVQIPIQEWNSMELGTNDAWVNYLKRKIFSEEI